MNLVGNAIKFTERGGVRLVATISEESPEPRLLIEVHDSGIGIPTERIESIFSPFEQADSSITRRFGGTGLGLAICRHIAEGLGGEIAAESIPGQGSVLRVKLSTGPLDQVRIFDSPPTEALTPAVALRPGSANTLAASRVLLVEDGESNRKLISLVLQEAGAEVTCAENGQDGLETASQGKFDLILMDMQMPVMDGYTATRHLRERGCTLPIVALTAHAMRGDREKCFEAGCSDYLTKPIDIDELIQAIANGLGRNVACAERLLPEAGHPLATDNRSLGNLPAITSTLPIDNPHFRPIVEAFVDRLQQRLAEMQTAREDSDWNKLAEFAHWLHGSGGTIGFNCFTEPAQRLQQLATTGRIPEIDDAIRQISALTDRIAVST